MSSLIISRPVIPRIAWNCNEFVSKLQSTRRQVQGAYIKKGHLNSATLPILGQNRSKNQQLEAPSELISPFNFHPLGSSIAWAPKPQSCCPDIGANSSETDLPPPNSGLFLPLKRPIDRPRQA